MAMTNECFINAYNFVPLGKGAIRAPLQKGDLTGKITCTLTPKTDFFIPNTSTDLLKCDGMHGDTVREFFSYEQLDNNYNISKYSGPAKPVIPGSELRGMIRSMYETMTDSCLSSLNTTPLSLRSVKPFEPALLVYDNTNKCWALQKAESTKLGASDDYPYENRHYIIENGKKYYTGDKFSYDGVSGLLIIGEPISGENHSFIFKGINEYMLTARSSEIIKKAIVNYNIALTEYYRNEKVNKQKGTFHTGKDIPVEPGSDYVFPVWAKIIAKKLYLSPAQIGREVYYNTIENIVDSYSSCQKSLDTRFCECCALFGTISDVDEKRSIGSRVRFSDALFTGKKPEYATVTTLKELGSPKKTTLEFYSKISDNRVSYRTYDYYGRGSENYSFVSSKKETKPLAIEISGRKFYYHHPANTHEGYYKYSAKIIEGKNSKRLVTVRPLKGVASNSFSFDVYFEKITKDELEKLVLVLSLMGNENDLCYKLGMGKPIGLGSVKIKVLDVILRQFSLDDGLVYRSQSIKAINAGGTALEKIAVLADKIGHGDLSHDDKAWSRFAIDKGNRDILMNLLDFKYAEKMHLPVTYPVSSDGPEGFKWFSNNRKIGANSGVEQELTSTGILHKNTKCVPSRNNTRSRH